MPVYNTYIEQYENCSDCCYDFPIYYECSTLFPDGIAQKWEAAISLIPTHKPTCLSCAAFSTLYRFDFEQSTFRVSCGVSPVPAMSGTLRCLAPIYYPFNNFSGFSLGSICLTDNYVYLFTRLIFAFPCSFSVLLRWRIPIVDFNPFGPNTLSLEYTNINDCTIPGTITIEPIS